MTLPLIERIANGSGGEESPALRIRIFRLVCAMTAVLCLFLIAPLNLLQQLPLGVHLANAFLGLSGAFCYWQSCRGRHLVASFLILIVGLLDVVWFLNAGLEGSVTYYFFPVMLFAIALFEGWRRWLLAVCLWIDAGLILLVGHFFPAWVTPFQNAQDRVVDMQTGLLCSFVALASIIWFVLINYTREQRRVSEIAARLSTSEENYREIFNSTSDALFVHGPDGQVLDVNERACAIFGAERSALLHGTFEEFSLGQKPYSREDALAKISLAVLGQPQVFEWRSRRASGELFWSEVALRVWELGGEKRVIAAVRDISLRKKIEQEHRDNEERLRLAMVASRQGWFELNVQTGRGISSPEYVQIIGYEPGEFVTEFQGWIAGIHPEDRDSVAKTFRACAESGETHTVEYRRQTKAGDWKWIRSVGRIVEYDSARKPLRMCGTHMDITERKELEAQLLHSQRLEAVGTLASGVAHDLNNILTPMLMATGILRDKLPDAHDRELIAMLDDGGKRGAAIVRQLLAFSRNLVEDREPVDLRRLLEEMAQLMRSTFPKEINIADSSPTAKGQFVVEAEPNQLHQVLMNLCVNARDAMSAGGTITLGLERVDLPPRNGSAEDFAGGGSYFGFSVADTGQGIPPEIIDRIFDPFFTTKPVGKGTGLGLASAHGIIKAHNGFLRVESQLGHGTIFRVYLPSGKVSSAVIVGPTSAPAPESKALAAPPGAGPAVAMGKKGSIMVVDDDQAVLFVTSRMLEVKGYRVFRADSGAEALRLLQQHLDEIVLVITDFSMPEMDGPTLAPLMRALSPSLRIIGVSGLTQDNQAGQLAELGFGEVLRKPYEMDDLVQAVARQFPVK